MRTWGGTAATRGATAATEAKAEAAEAEAVEAEAAEATATDAADVEEPDELLCPITKVSNTKTLKPNPNPKT